MVTPPLPIHPEPHTYAWTQSELEAIEAYGKLCRKQALGEAAKKRAGSPRKLQKVGTGALHDEQQYCFDKGFKEGAASVRCEIKKML